MFQRFLNACAPLCGAGMALTGMFSCLPAHAGTAQPGNPALTAFEHVCVLPMDANRVLHATSPRRSIRLTTWIGMFSLSDLCNISWKTATRRDFGLCLIY